MSENNKTSGHVNTDIEVMVLRAASLARDLDKAVLIVVGDLIRGGRGYLLMPIGHMGTDSANKYHDELVATVYPDGEVCYDPPF